MKYHQGFKKIITILMIIFLSNGNAYTQTDTTWNYKKCAVVLTYDDGLNIDLNHVIPALDSVGLKGTFYISDYFNGFKCADKWMEKSCCGRQ